MSQLRIGTCSWKYESWQGLIYPEFGDFNYLEEYSKYFSTVEIDQWFWSLHPNNKITLPNPKVVNEYSRSTPEDFRFTIKIPNSLSLTHPYKSKIPNQHFLSSDLMETFLDSIKGLKPKVGMLMFQFEYLNRQKMILKLNFSKDWKNYFSNLIENIIMQ